MKPIAAVGVLILLLTACTGKRYGHYGYVKRGEEKAAVKTYRIRQQSLRQPERLTNKTTAITVTNYSDTILPKEVSIPVNKPDKTQHSVSNENIGRQSATTIVGAVENEAQRNKKASNSLGYGLVAYVVILIPILGIAFSIAFAIIAIRRGMEALREMDTEPGKYKNRASAIAGVALGIIFLSILIFAILMLMFSAVGFTIPFIPFF